MSLDGILGGLQVHGIGCESTNIGYTIGFVIPQDVNVVLKNKQDFDRYVVKYNEMQSILNDLDAAGAIIKERPISPRVSIYGGIPAFGAWACYEIELPGGNGRGNGSGNGRGNFNTDSSVFRKINNLIPTKF